MKKIFITLAAALTLFIGQQLLPASAFAATDPNVCQGIQDASGTTSCSSDGSSITGLVRTVITILSLVVGFAAVIMIIVGGLKYVTSNGDTSNTASAKNTIIYAVVGLVIAALAQFLVQFVINKTGPKCATNQSISNGRCVTVR